MLKKAQGHRFAITASTGIASVNIGGTTLHSWAGIGLGKEGAEKLAGMVLGKRDLRERWRDTKTLIIDEIFVDMLNSMRFGQLTPDAIDKFRNLSRPLVYDDGIEPTELFPTRAEVDHANMTRLNRINERAHNYMSQDYPGTDSNDQRIGREKMEKLLGHLIAQKEITLKVGAQVMLIKNLVQGSLVNGSVGKVVAFVNHHDAESRGVQIAQIEGEEAKPSAAAAAAAAARKQDIVWPLVEFPGYERGILCDPKEFTVDNGQAVRVKVNLRRIFEKGQAYVALSRATSMETLEVLYFDPAKVVAHPRVIQWHRELTEGRHYDDDFDEEMDNEEALQSYYAD
ncbi:hypothetical protein EWM64_g883 [Hericium alpestre]|uniref:ATP-dependent DNA helicase n=1 Tax=Hericium alpestre TaxID=135208 RepID=A0A4Z0A9W5_9AGAM|nr:hypothetical protein EWM64_g883 [Hericium alpestre]